MTRLGDGTGTPLGFTSLAAATSLNQRWAAFPTQGPSPTEGKGASLAGRDGGPN